MNVKQLSECLQAAIVPCGSAFKFKDISHTRHMFELLLCSILCVLGVYLKHVVCGMTPGR